MHCVGCANLLFPALLALLALLEGIDECICELKLCFLSFVLASDESSEEFVVAW